MFVSEFRRHARGTGDVRDKHGREHPLCRGLGAFSRHELLDLVQGGTGVPDPVQVVPAFEFNELGAGDVLGQIAPERGTTYRLSR